MRSVRFSLLLTMLAIAPLARGEQRKFRGPIFEPTPETFGTPEVLRLLAGADAASAPDAAIKAEALWKDHADELTPLTGTQAADGAMLSVSAVIDALPSPQRDQIGAQWRKTFDPAARRALEALRQETTSRPDEFYALARRYPWSTAAAPALAEAADRAALAGDADTAASLYALASRASWQPDPAHAAAWASALYLSGKPAPADMPDPVAKRLAALLSAKPLAYHATVPIDAPWYGRADAVSNARYLPLLHENTFFVCGPRSVAAIRDTGQTLWKWAGNEALAKSAPVDRAPGSGRGTTYAPAVFSTANAQVVVVRQPRGPGRDFVLRALRAADGKLLWSTESTPGLDNVSIASNPALAGRTLFCVGVEFAEGAPLLLLISLDLTDGRLLWKCTLGSLPSMRSRREEPPAWDAFWEQSEPAVGDDAVYLTPNVATAFAVDRYLGKIRWTRIYEPEVVEYRKGGKRPVEQDRASIPADPAELLRFRDTPHVAAGTVIIAPRDNPTTWGLDSATGVVRWSDKPLSAWTLLGGDPATAVFAGSSVRALETSTGKELWRWDAASFARLSGPPALAGNLVQIPTSDARTTVLDLTTGKPAEAKPRTPNLRQFFANEAVRRTLDEIWPAKK